MAKEWYLMKSPYAELSGFESDAFNDFAQEGFAEVLESEMAVDVELCNYDLSECKPIRAVIQDKLQDTKLKSLNRLLLVPIGSCKAGMYIKYKDRYWLIVGLVDDNKVYEKAVMTLCNYQLMWINASNQIVQRWANVTSASQHNNGETSNQNLIIRTDQLLVLTPDDDECLLLSSGDRFIIDRRCKIYEKSFDDSVVTDTSNSVITYHVTRSDSVFYNYQDSGHFEFLATQDEQHEKDGYYVVDGKGYWLCMEPYVEDKNVVLSSKIEYDSLEIFNGLEPSVFIAKFFDASGNEVNVTPQWNINCDFADQLEVEYIDNAISIFANSKSLINKSFELSLSAEGYETVSVTVTIRAFV